MKLIDTKLIIISVVVMVIFMASVLFLVEVSSRDYDLPPETNPSCEIYRNTEFYKLPARCVKEYK